MRTNIKLLAVSVVLLLGGSTAYAQPPRTGLCAGLTGDALTRCLYSDLDDRLRELEPAPPSSPSPTTQPTTPPPPPATGAWLSGAAGTEAANGTFGTWRGSPVEIAEFWVNDPALYPIGPKITGCATCGEWASFAGPVSISASPPSWKGWASEAAGGNDAFWTALARNAKALRTGKGQVYLNPYYEFNGDWMPFSVTRTAAGMADFRTAYERTSAIISKEFPGAKLVINAAAGRGVPTEMWPASTSFDLIGVDLYNEWPHCATTDCVPTFLARIEPLRAAAVAKGKPIAFPEWGNSAVASSDGGGGESVAVIDGLFGYFRDHAGTGPGQVVYETYFNIGGYPARYELFTAGRANPAQPLTAAAYRDRF